jgi:hypothetical protein
VRPFVAGMVGTREQVREDGLEHEAEAFPAHLPIVHVAFGVLEVELEAEPVDVATDRGLQILYDEARGDGKEVAVRPVRVDGLSSGSVRGHAPGPPRSAPYAPSLLAGERRASAAARSVLRSFTR